MIPAWFRSPELYPLWTALHTRLTRNGRTPTGKLRLTGLTEDERIAAAQLLSRPVELRPTVDLAVLDRMLWESSAEAGLVTVVEAVLGPVPDRRTDAAVETARRGLLRDDAETALVAAGLDDCTWAPEWLDRVWRGGLAARQPTDETRRLLTQAARTLGFTVGAHSRLWSRGELAQAVTGTAHGLDDDTALTRLVLRGLALAITGAADPPTGAVERRARWESAGVSQETVATTVLTYGLRPLGDDWRAEHLRARADAHAETHLSLREVRSLAPLRLVPQTVYVCENPRVLEAAVEAGVSGTLVCTMGNPTTVTRGLLDAVLQTPEVRLSYHGDFDWPGLAIADRIIRRYAASPWRFRAADYLEAVASAADRGTPLPALTGRPTPSGWDPSLAEAMAETKLVVHEEGVVERLLSDLGT
jgi:uncharacterized protein (TIGR02679 family)